MRGWNVMLGYFGMPEETAETLAPDGWLSTGDLGRLGTDGRLEFCGRAKDVIRVGGENVSPPRSRTSCTGIRGCGRPPSSRCRTSG